VHAGRQFELELWQQCLHGVGDRDGVRARLTLNAQRDGALFAPVCVEPRRRPLILDAVHDRAKLAEPDRCAVAVRHHHVLVLIGVHQLAGRLQREGLVRSDDRAGRRVDVPGAERRLDFVDADLPRRERVRIQLRMDGVLLAAQHLDLRDAADHRDTLRDARFGVLVERPRRHGGGRDDKIENGLVGGIHFGEGGRRWHALRQQARRLGDCRLHVHGGAVETPVQVELERDLRGAERVHRRHRLEPRDHRELVLERRRH
jgi:hypothetical protein